jgi:hypothetical protein
LLRPEKQVALVFRELFCSPSADDGGARDQTSGKDGAEVKDMAVDHILHPHVFYKPSAPRKWLATHL